jgi:hypothetical protein
VRGALLVAMLAIAAPAVAQTPPPIVWADTPFTIESVHDDLDRRTVSYRLYVCRGPSPCDTVHRDQARREVHRAGVTRLVVTLPRGLYTLQLEAITASERLRSDPLTIDVRRRPGTAPDDEFPIPGPLYVRPLTPPSPQP